MATLLDGGDRGLVEIGVHDLRDHTDDPKHRTVDDAPFGGGPGMVMRAEPYWRAVEALLPDAVDILVRSLRAGLAKALPYGLSAKAEVDLTAAGRE